MVGLSDIADLFHGRPPGTSTSTATTLTRAKVSAQFLPFPEGLEKISEKKRIKLIEKWMDNNKSICLAQELPEVLEAAAFAALFFGQYAIYRSNPALQKKGTRIEKYIWGYTITPSDPYYQPFQCEAWQYELTMEMLKQYYPTLTFTSTPIFKEHEVEYTYINESFCLGLAAALTSAAYIARDSPAAMAIPLSGIASSIVISAAEQAWNKLLG